MNKDHTIVCEDCLDGERVFGAGFTGEKIHWLRKAVGEQADVEVAADWLQQEDDDLLYSFL